MKLRSIALTVTGTLFLALTAFAQITTIEGDVKGTDGKPLEKAVVKISRTDMKGNYDTKTNKKGHYLYMGLPIGKYTVECYVDGKLAQSQSGVQTHLGDPVAVNFDLKSAQSDKASQSAEFQKALETGQMSKEMERGMTAEQKAQLEKQIKDQAEKMKKNHELNDAFNTGMTAMQASKWDEAVTAFTKASELDPSQVAVWAQLGEANMKLADTKTGPEFDATIQKSQDAYAKAIELKPDDAGSHNNYALALAKGKKFPEMQAELKKAADLDPANGGKYFYNLGAILTNSGQNDAASDAFKRAIELTPTYADAYYQYGVTLVSKATIGADGKISPVPGTADAFQKYLELQPNGQYAQSAKEMLATLGSTVETNFTDPNAKKAPTTTKKKK